MARRGVLGLMGGMATFVLSGCGLGPPSYRFKMTVEVDTPEGLKSGSSVYEVVSNRQTDLVSGGSSSTAELRGEAVAVDLGGGKTLFALLRLANAKNDDDNLAIMSMKTLDPNFAYKRADTAERRLKGDGIRSPGDVASADYPMLVTFGNITDPASVVRVDPTNLLASFGSGVKLKRIWVEKTREAVTAGIEERLGWLLTHRGTLKPNPPSFLDDPKDPDLRILGIGPFSTELHK